MAGSRQPVLPDLAELPRNLLVKSLVRFALVGSLAKENPDKGWLANLLRLTDKSVREYGLAREAFEAFKAAPPGAFDLVFRGTDHLENCISATHRGFAFAQELRRSRQAPAISARFPRPRELRLLKEVRDALEHMEQNLKKKQIGQIGEPYALDPQTEAVIIGQLSLPYGVLAGCIRKLHEIATELVNADWRELDTDS